MSFWLEKAAIQWSSTEESIHWDDEILKELRPRDAACFISYRTLISLLFNLVPLINLPCRGGDGGGVPIVVAIPEGPLLPIAVLLVHILPHAVLVPMEPAEGKERLRHMMSDCRPPLVLCLPGEDWKKMEGVIAESDCGQKDCVVDGLLQSSKPQLLDFRAHVLQALVHMGNSDDPSQDDDRLSIWDILNANDKTPRTSHIVYTSGTTGIPKGCKSSYAAIRHYLSVKNEAHGIDSSSNVLLASALSFDPCLSDILATIQAKATLCITPRKLVLQSLSRVVCELQVTHVLCTPTLWSMMECHDYSQTESLQVVVLGGEPIPKRILQTWSTRVGLYATYGVTEACVYQTMGRIVDDTTVNVGCAFPGMTIRIVSEHDPAITLMNDGEVGEVVLYGDLLDNYSGYLNQPELTQSKFIMMDEIHCYRTGDRGYLNNGNLVIKGRITGQDGMVKVNGVRVELGEIEAALIDDPTNNAPGVVNASLAAVKCEDQEEEQNTKQIHAFCVLSQDCSDEIGLRWHDGIRGIVVSGGPLLVLFRLRCLQRVKSGALPSTYILIPRVPSSPTGKSDRRQLPDLAACISMDELNTESIPELLRDYGMSGVMVADMVTDILNLQPCQRSMLTTRANFAMLGGDSLAATRVVRGLFASHYCVHNSRFLGGSYGSLEGPFSVVHLLCSQKLGDYVDWLDKHDLCGMKIAANDEKSMVSVASELPVDGSSFGPEYEALLEATTAGQSSIAVGLLNAGVDPNAGLHGGRLGKVSDRIERKQKFTSNPLHVACSKGNHIIVRGLLNKGCKLNSPDASGNFPLHLAASGAIDATSTDLRDQDDRNRTECVKLLLEAGAPISMKCGNKQTVLHSAARSGHCQMLRYLVSYWKEALASGTINQKGGKLDWPDRWYRTPVHWAVLNGRADALKILLEEGFSAEPPLPALKDSKKSTSVALESPLQICNRLFDESDEKWLRIRHLLNENSNVSHTIQEEGSLLR